MESSSPFVVSKASFSLMTFTFSQVNVTVGAFFQYCTHTCLYHIKALPFSFFSNESKLGLGSPAVEKGGWVITISQCCGKQIFFFTIQHNKNDDTKVPNVSRNCRSSS